MKQLIAVLVAMVFVALTAACSTTGVSSNVVDATPAKATFAPQVKSGFGAVVTGRDWNNQPSESGGGEAAK